MPAVATHAEGAPVQRPVRRSSLPMTTSLTKYEAARSALAEAHRVDEVKDIRDKAEAMAAYARQAKDNELIQYATEIKVRAERRCGELLSRTEKQHGGHAMKARSNDATEVPPTLAQMGLTKDESSRYQQLAAMPAEHFETAVATAKATAGEVTTAFMLREAKRHAPPMGAALPSWACWAARLTPSCWQQQDRARQARRPCSALPSPICGTTPRRRRHPRAGSALHRLPARTETGAADRSGCRRPCARAAREAPQPGQRSGMHAWRCCYPCAATRRGAARRLTHDQPRHSGPLRSAR